MRKYLAVACIAILLGGSAMAEETAAAPDLTALEAKIALLTAQISLLNEETALAKAKAAAEAGASLAELTSIQAAIKDLSLPTGQEGTITLAKGGENTALLRSYYPLVMLLDEAAAEIGIELDREKGAILLTEAQLEGAYKAEMSRAAIENQYGSLRSAWDEAKPRLVSDKGIDKGMGLAPFTAAAYSIGFVLDTAQKLATLLRVDRSIGTYSAEAEARRMLGYLLEIKNANVVAMPEIPAEALVAMAESRRNELNELFALVEAAETTVEQLKKIEEAEAPAAAESARKIIEARQKAIAAKATADAARKSGTADELKAASAALAASQIAQKDAETAEARRSAASQLPAVEASARLAAQIQTAKSLLDTYDPTKKPEAFWALVEGGCLYALIENRDRLTLDVRAQVLQITEKRWYSGERIAASGEIEIAYRLMAPSGERKASGLILKASKPEPWRFVALPEIRFSTAKAK